MDRLQGQRVVVFGGSSGVGRATAIAAAAAGAEVVLTGRDPDRVAAAAERAGGNSRGVVVDGRDPDGIRSLFDALGEIRHLVVPAGQTTRGGAFVGELTLERFRENFDGKFWVQVAVVHAAAPHVQRGGSITVISGGAAHRALPGMTDIAAINGAIEAIVPPLARELAPTRVNAVSPGTLATGYWRGVPQADLDGIFGRVASQLPAGRVGTAEDIAQAVMFLMTSDFVTGTVLAVDGGIAVSSL
jgi:NAD(P)-dependent dehydrogenase (short-subunit alcohol dehydrogenase family)